MREERTCVVRLTAIAGLRGGAFHAAVSACVGIVRRIFCCDCLRALAPLRRGWAVSSVKCNTSNEILLELREDFVGRLEAEDFARAVVQGMLNGSEFLMRDVAQVHTFG